MIIVGPCLKNKKQTNKKDELKYSFTVMLVYKTCCLIAFSLQQNPNDFFVPLVA